MHQALLIDIVIFVACWRSILSRIVINYRPLMMSVSVPNTIRRWIIFAAIERQLRDLCLVIAPELFRGKAKREEWQNVAYGKTNQERRKRRCSCEIKYGTKTDGVGLASYTLEVWRKSGYQFG